MTFVGSMFNNSQGAGFQATGAPINNPVGQKEIDQSAIDARQANLGIGNLVNEIAAQQGFERQGDVYQQQQALAQMLQAQAAGQGPNPALHQLAQATQANTANQAALMASQRGASQNAGLIARQAGMQGAANQQNMAGQAATMQAQQQIAAQQMLAQQQQAMAANASSLAGMQAQAQMGRAGATQGLYGQQLNAMNQYNQVALGDQSNKNSVNGTLAGINAQGQWNTMKQVGGGIQKLAGLGFADGGMVPSGSSFGKFMSGLIPDSGAMQFSPVNMPGGPSVPMLQWDSSSPKGKSSASGMTAGGPMDDMGGAGESPMDLLGPLAQAAPMVANHGAVVPGQAEVHGDSKQNDTVPAMLSPGEIVIPRSVVNSKNAPDQAKKFVAALLAKQGKKA